MSHLSVYLYEDRGSPIADLFFPRSPLAVPCCVRPIIIDAFDGMVRRWLLSHVSMELQETIPIGANFDASAAVIGVLFVIGVVASGPHPNPCMVCISHHAMDSNQAWGNSDGICSARFHWM